MSRGIRKIFRPGRRRLFAVLACLVLAQAAVILHSGDHDSLQQQSSCSLCAAANHMGGPLFVDFSFEASIVRLPAPPSPVERPVFPRLIHRYHSRAPPTVA